MYLIASHSWYNLAFANPNGTITKSCLNLNALNPDVNIDMSMPSLVVLQLWFLY